MFAASLYPTNLWSLGVAWFGPRQTKAELAAPDLGNTGGTWEIPSTMSLDGDLSDCVIGLPAPEKQSELEHEHIPESKGTLHNSAGRRGKRAMLRMHFAPPILQARL
ncbi:unnamed protein product [Acanthoscelides obtectus]|uniref:Uncharacterized protein n=1 Tax=Acanthoscelides obtectus TaxID=200917 RepID=A0A9P0QEG8_ACAOB|nr:unnamed protein product [Acanthoscelides obtectus]CAK1622543.1 hypothetical protein AOBTE_LOCUS1552 [Acanthoscelides obtectus]